MEGLVWQSCIRGVRDEHAASLPQERSKLLPRYCAWARLFALMQCNPRPKNAMPGPAALPPSAKRNPLRPSALACSLARSMARGAPWLRNLYAYLTVDQPGSLKNKIFSCILKILTSNFQVDLAKGSCWGGQVSNQKLTGQSKAKRHLYRPWFWMAPVTFRTARKMQSRTMPLVMVWL